jgi:thymidylate kinase
VRTSKQLTIFEGCDGSGKTTTARTYAELTEAKYVHFHNLPRVNHGLARIYVEAMLPALLGYENVVFDRSWFSETPYGEAFREGQDRLTNADRRMLERLALRCGAVMVLCDPSYEVAEANFLSRKGQEYLKTTAQLKQVHQAYLDQPCQLPVVVHNYLDETEGTLAAKIAHCRHERHPLELASAGAWDAEIVLVGESFAERKDQDPWYQWPFASLSLIHI